MPKPRTKTKLTPAAAQYARKDWHAPEIHDRKLLRLRGKQNTWPGFFHTVGEIFAAHQNPVVYPKVEIIPTKVWRKRAKGRWRSKKSRERERKAREEKRWWDHELDKVVFRQVQLRRSEIGKVVAEMHLEPGADEWLSPAELKKLDGKALAAVVRWALKALKDRRAKDNP